jgi:uncharacterized protein YkwD
MIKWALKNSIEWKRKAVFMSIFCCFHASIVLAQPNGQAAEVFSLINQARTDPQGFLSNYSIYSIKCSEKFVHSLYSANPLPAVVWDNGLAAMAKEEVTKGNLDPEYPGSPEGFYVSSSGSGSNSSGIKSIDLLCNFYTAINSAAQTHFGLYLESGKYAFYWGTSLTVNDDVDFTYENVPDTSLVDFEKLNTAKNENYLTPYEKEMVKEINFVRYYPQIYADIVGKHVANESEVWDGIDKEDMLATTELISELKAATPRSILQPKECLYRAAEKHGKDCQKRGFSDHKGSDASMPWDRIASFCGAVKGNENIVGSSGKNARADVINLLIDSGISSRGHRYNMLDENWNYVGCFQYVENSTGKNTGFNMYMTIQNYANK